MRTKRVLALAAVAALPVLAIGWAAFRPELLFVNSTANEAAPTAKQTTTIATGTFEGYAHETTGKATLLKADGKTVLRLTGFATSNGPDVRVYLVKGSGSDKASVDRNGYLDLGTIKGNQGDQNYAVPAGTNLDQYGAVAIWCKRFAVDFGGATLDRPVAAVKPTIKFASFGGEVTVTTGKFSGGYGKATFLESNGKRFLQVAGGKAPVGTRVLLLNTETVTNAGVAKTAKLDLGAIRAGKGPQRFPIAKDVDAWLYRVVSLWNGKSLAVAPLRSAQERQTF